LRKQKIAAAVPWGCAVHEILLSEYGAFSLATHGALILMRVKAAKNAGAQVAFATIGLVTSCRWQRPSNRRSGRTFRLKS
jgi:hypothetical protein